MFGAGSTFSLSAVLGPLSGILFGPRAGALCSAAGGFVGSLIAPHTAWLGLGTFIIGTVIAWTSGCIAWGSPRIVSVDQNGSLVISGGLIVYALGTLLWFSQEAGRNLPLFPAIYYGLGFIAFLLGSIFSRSWLTGERKIFRFIALWLCAFGGLIGGAGIGNFFFLLLYQLPREVWQSLILISPLERAVFALGAAIIGGPLLAGLPKIGLFVGPGWEKEESEGE
jgi:hypothetical protein